MDENLHTSTHFKYTALPDPTNYIRLIEVHQPVGFSHSPSITIFDTIIQDAPADYEVPTYDAISYTWGNATEEERINIRHRSIEDTDQTGTMMVRKNCCDVLRQLSHFATLKYYWLDAICINQADESEREKQVVLMSYIFGRARCVLACVGMHGNDSAFLANTLDDFDSFLAAREVSSGLLTIRPSQYEKIPSVTRRSREDFCIQLCCAWVGQTTASTFERFFKALDHFARRPYFWRIWILQELGLADQIRFLCGDSELRLSTVLFWWRDAKLMTLKHSVSAGDLNGTAKMSRLIMSRLSLAYFHEVLWKDRHYFYEHGGSGLGSAFEDMLSERQALRSSAQGFNRRLMAVPDILKMCEYRQCQDARDCVYGTLALGNWRPSVSLCKGGFHVNAGDIVRPDYSMSAFSLAKLLVPGFHDVPQLNRLVMGMLGLSHSDPEVQTGLNTRSNALLDVISLSKMPPRQICNDMQRLVHIVEGGIQMTLESSWSVSRQTTAKHQFTQVLDADGRCCAITSVQTEPGDWLIPTHYGRGFVLRQWGTLYAVLGKAYCPPDLWSDELQMTAFMMWYDPDDLLIHLVGGLRGLATDDIDPPSEEMLEHLKIGICDTENSSYGQLPSRNRTWPASAFAFDTLGVCEMVVRDCYEDNEKYWFT